MNHIKSKGFLLLARVFFAAIISYTGVILISSPAYGAPSAPSAATPGTVPDPPSSPDGSVNDSQASAAFSGVTSVVGQGSRSSLTFALNRMGLWTTPTLTQKTGDKANWFITHYRMMRVMGLYVLMPMVLFAIAHAVIKASLSLLLKTVFLFLPLAILGTVVAIDLVQLLLSITDDFSQVFINAILSDSNDFFGEVSNGLGDQVGIPILIDLLMSIGLAITSIFVYVVLVVREGSIYLATSFLPIGFSVMVWPATARFFKRMIEFLFGLVLSKVVMVACISLAIAALTAASTGGVSSAALQGGLSVNGGNVASSGTTSSTADSGLDEITNILAAIAMLLIVCFAPHMTISLVARLGVGEMGQHVGNHLLHPSGVSQLLFYDRMIGNSQRVGELIDNVGAGRAASRARVRYDSPHALQYQRMAGFGITPNDAGNFEIDDAMLDDAGITDQYYRDLLMEMTSANRNDANDVVLAYAALGMGQDFAGFLGDRNHPTDPGNLNGALGTTLLSHSNNSQIVLNIARPNGRNLRGIPEGAVYSMVEAEVRRQVNENGSFGSITVRTPGMGMDVDGRPRQLTQQERRMQRHVLNATSDVRRNYRTHNGMPARIYTSTRPARPTMQDYANRPVNTNSARHERRRAWRPPRP